MGIVQIIGKGETCQIFHFSEGRDIDVKKEFDIIQLQAYFMVSGSFRF
jgi:hypothetical protein